MRITAQAENDLADIWAFIAADSPENASAFVREIENRFEPLRHHPEMGPSREHLGAGVRAQFHRNYVIYYRATDTELIIVRVLHGARDISTLLAPSPETPPRAI